MVVRKLKEKAGDMQKSAQWVLSVLVTIQLAAAGSMWNDLKALQRQYQELAVSLAKIPKENPPPEFERRMGKVETGMDSMRKDMQAVREDLIQIKADIRYIKQVTTNPHRPSIE